MTIIIVKLYVRKKFLRLNTLILEVIMKDNKHYYVTTPIYYASGHLTVGHCFSTVLADICARF